MIAALLTLTGATVYVGRVVVTSRIDPLPAPPERVGPDPLLEEVADLTRRIDKLTFAVADGIERVARAENRIAKTVTSARRLVRENSLEHAGIEAEFDELKSTDAERVEPLPAVPEAVESYRTVRIPGGRIQIG